MTHEEEAARRLVRSAFAVDGRGGVASGELRARVARSLSDARESGRRRKPGANHRWRVGITIASLGAAALVVLLAAILVLPRVTRPSSLGAPSAVVTPGQFLFKAFGDPNPVSSGVLAEATSNGYTVRVMNAFDDGNIFLLDFQVTKAGTNAAPIADAFPDGRYDPAIHGSTLTVTCDGVTTPQGATLGQIEVPGLTTDQQDALQSVFMGPVTGTRSGVSNAITVDIREIEFGGPNLPGQGPAGQGWKGFKLVSGTWHLSLSVPVSRSTRSITPPGPLKVGAAGVTFTSALVGGDSYLELVNTCATSDCGGQTVYGPDGHPLALIGAATVGLAGNGRPLLANFYELAEGVGTYTVLFAAGNGKPTAQTTFAVPVANPKPVRIPPVGAFGPKSIPPPTNVPTFAPASPTPSATAAPTPSGSPSPSPTPTP